MPATTLFTRNQSRRSGVPAPIPYLRGLAAAFSAVAHQHGRTPPSPAPLTDTEWGPWGRLGRILLAVRVPLAGSGPAGACGAPQGVVRDDLWTVVCPQ